jgi:prefoldin beta subunit
MVTEEDRKFLGQFQSYQQQVAMIDDAKKNLKFQIMEIEKAVEELEASKEKEAYKITGTIMIKKSSTDLKNELKEKKEKIDLTLKNLEKTEERAKTKLKEMEPKLREMIKE